MACPIAVARRGHKAQSGQNLPGLRVAMAFAACSAPPTITTGVRWVRSQKSTSSLLLILSALYVRPF
jgi:hypothetical protein